MILRKPYAFFIKHFKLFNIILTILGIYLIYKLGFIFQFFLDYYKNPIGAVGQDLTGALINNLIYIVGFSIIGFSLIIMSVLSFKKKPIKLYMFSIIVNSLVLILIFVINNILGTIEIRIIDNRTAYAIRDFTLIAIILEFLITIFTLMRSIGFDIKHFSFLKDLEDMKIDIKDNEEFELQIDVDSSKFKRDINRNKRYFKYFIYEHKVSIIVVVTLILGITSYIIYSKTGIYFDMVKQNKLVNIDNITVGVSSSYITNKDYIGNKIFKDKDLVAINIKIKTNSLKQKLNVARFKLVVDKTNYLHTTLYNEKIIDLGKGYTNEIITTEFNEYLLVFEIPKDLSNKKMYLEYDTENDKKVKFKLDIKNLDNDNLTITNNITEKMDFNNELIKDGYLLLNNYEINDKFKIDYKFCITKDECYDSYEYLVPDYKSNYDKTLLKIEGNIELKKSNISISDLYDFINKFGTLVYTIDNETKRQNISFKEVKPTKTKVKDTYYIEVLDEVKNASSISIELKLRNRIYIYKIK